MSVEVSVDSVKTVLEIGLIIITAIGGLISWLLKDLRNELKQLRGHVANLESHIERVDMRMSFCKYCPQPAGKQDEALRKIIEED